MIAIVAAALLFDKRVEAQEGQPMVAPHRQCRLWLAPSTLTTEKEPKLGVFAGIDFDENATMAESEIGIPLVDFNLPELKDSPTKTEILEFLEGYMWTGDYAGAKWEGKHTVTTFIPGLGVLANYHSGTYNVDWNQEGVYTRDKVGVPDTGQPHVSRGAISVFYNMTFKSTKAIQAGEELFANFGDVWDGNSTDDIYQDKLTRWDYKDADLILNGILEFMEELKEHMTPELQDDILDFLLRDVLGAAAGKRAKVLRSLIPAHPGKLQKVKDIGGTFAYRNPDLVTKLEWLQKNGRCMDNLKVGPSTIPEAGRGAFATRAIKKHQVIAPAPMLHIPDRGILNMYKLEEKQNEYGESVTVPNYNKPIGKQLIMNYAFGHPKSSMLLVPVGSMVTFINHNAKPNARLAWSSLLNKKASIWRNMDPLDMLDEPMQHVGIVLEVIANRDIGVGEEIFIDYGRDWTNAWNKYVQTWNANNANKGKWPVRAIDLNQVHKTEPFKTRAELQKEPHPDNVATACFIETEEQEDGLQKVNKDGLMIDKWVGPETPEEFQGVHMVLCDIVTRTKDEQYMFNYTVVAQTSSDLVEVRHVPQFAIKFVDKPYQSDTFAKGAFRHWIGLPPWIMPDAWRNLEN